MNKSLFKLVILLSLTLVVFSEECAPDWGWCSKYDWATKETLKRECCSPMQHCYSEDPNAEWVGCTDQDPTELAKVYFPPPTHTPDSVCGVSGTNWTKRGEDVASPLELAKIWVSATRKLSMGAWWQDKNGTWYRPDAPGGKATCVAAVSLALGECGHSSGSDCSVNASGAGGYWQVTSQDTVDTGLAGCSDGTDPCCGARLAYAHAWQTGHAVHVPENYCEQAVGNCKMDPSETLKDWVKDQALREQVSLRKPGSVIPSCNNEVNPWYTASEAAQALDYPAIDQEPCYWGPFGIAAGGYVKSFFLKFNYAGSYFQHYVDSCCGMCDPSPQVIHSQRCYDGYGDTQSYYELAVAACAQVEDDPDQVACHSSCKTCNGESEFNCQSCYDGKFLKNNQCVLDCGSQFFADSSDSKCKSCDTSCLSCSGPNNNECLTCPVGKELVSGKCQEPAAQCHSSCKTCNGQTQYDCLSCENLFLKSGQCLSDCGVGFFSDSSNWSCKACSSTCKTCIESATKCTSCNPPKILQNSQCIEDTSLQCDASCLTCQGSPTTCTSCRAPKELLNSQCVSPINFCKFDDTKGNLLYNGQCVKKCPVNHYSDLVDMICKQCHSSCTNCHGPSELDCQACQFDLNQWPNQCE